MLFFDLKLYCEFSNRFFFFFEKCSSRHQIRSTMHVVIESMHYCYNCDRRKRRKKERRKILFRTRIISFFPTIDDYREREKKREEGKTITFCVLVRSYSFLKMFPTTNRHAHTRTTARPVDLLRRETTDFFFFFDCSTRNK